MNGPKKLLERIALSTDLTPEAFCALPIVEIIGTNRVLIEHHLGITAYEAGQISVKTCNEQIHISGSNLCLLSMSKEQLVISGDITGVSLENRR